MPHHDFANRPHISLEEKNAAVARAHRLRSQSFTGFFKKALDRRHRALHLER